MSAGRCARQFRDCDAQAGGYDGRFTDLCWKCARARVQAIQMRAKNRRQTLLGRAR